MTDDQFTALFQRAVATLDPDVPALVEAGVATGRRRHRIRRAVEAGTALAVAGGLVTAGLVVTSGSGTSPAHPAPAGHSTSSAVAAKGPEYVAITPQYAVRTLIDLLPRPGKTSHYTGRYTDGQALAELVYDDGHGASKTYVAVSFPPDHPNPKSADPSPCNEWDPASFSGTCTHLPSGAWVTGGSGLQYPKGRPVKYNSTENYVKLVRADGVEVDLTSVNSTASKDAPLTRDQPPLTVKELIAIADSQAWTARITTEQAASVAGLFHADDLDASLARDESAPPDPQAEDAARTNNCRRAKAILANPRISAGERSKATDGVRRFC